MIKLMVIDDEAGICHFLKEFFQKRGHIVLTSQSPEEALSILRKEKPRVILLDILMPQISGLELLKKIREEDKDVKIIMVSIAGQDSNVQEALRLGADAFVKKPFSVEYLEEVVMAKILELIK